MTERSRKHGNSVPVRRIRPFARLRAFLTSYFWIHCRRCGTGFAGSEWRGYEQTIGIGAGAGQCVYCPWCAATRDLWDPDWHQYLASVVVPGWTP